MKNLKLLKSPINLNNPITVQVLGICSALAVTVQLNRHWSWRYPSQLLLLFQT